MSGKLKRVPASVEKSPQSKRIKFSSDYLQRTDGLTDRWTLTDNEIHLNPVQDIGIGQLDSDSNEKNSDLNQDRSAEIAKQSPKTKAKQISILQNSLPENTLEKLTTGQLNHLLMDKQTTEKSKEKIDYFSTLSDEIVLCIFQKLPRTSLGNVKLVSRRFHRLAEDESLWTKMDISNAPLEQGEFGKIMSRQVVILRAARTEFKLPFDAPCRATLPNFRSRLMYLDLSMACISTSNLTEILSKCQRLKRISLENVPVDTMVLAALADNKDLEIINFAMAMGIEIDGLKYLLTNCRKIRELNVSWTSLNGSAIDYLCDNLPSTLDRLNLAGCRKLLEDNNVNDLVRRCPKLRELDLSDCTAITGISIRNISTLEQLSFLGLSRCYLIPCKALYTLRKLNCLRHLEIHGGYILARDMKNLKETLGDDIIINKFLFSSIARPTFGGTNRSSIWNIKIR